MRTKIKYIIAIFLLIAISCQDEILDKKINTAFTTQSVFGDIETAKLNLLQSYNSLETWGMVGGPSGAWWLNKACMKPAASDEAWFHWTPSQFPQNLGVMDESNMGYFQATWGIYYKWIGNLNSWFQEMENSVLIDEFTDESEELMGEAKFLRANLYLKLVNFWGGVPLIKEPFELTDDFNRDRDSYEECIEYIVSELDEAADMLPETRPDPEWGRVTKGACLALKSRALLYAASELHDSNTQPGGPFYDYKKSTKWEDAANAAKAVLDLNLYSMVQVNDWKEYHNIFIGNSSEVILARPFHPEFGDKNGLPDKANSPGGYNGWAVNQASHNVAQAYEMANGKMINEPGSGYDSSPEKIYENRDPRFYANILFNGVEYRGRDVEYWTPGGLDSKDGLMGDIHEVETGYCIRKFMHEDYDFDSEGAPIPFINIRLAEIYLNYAEALYHSGDETNARINLNLVRDRVGMPWVETSGQELLDDIRHERRIELCFEGFHRYNDARRWMTAEEEFNKPLEGIQWSKDPASGELSYEVRTVEPRIFQPQYYYLPIPLSEINKTELEQNWGY